jgi:hypothetical protein
MSWQTFNNWQSDTVAKAAGQVTESLARRTTSCLGWQKRSAIERLVQSSVVLLREDLGKSLKPCMRRHLRLMKQLFPQHLRMLGGVFIKLNFCAATTSLFREV